MSRAEERQKKREQEKEIKNKELEAKGIIISRQDYRKKKNRYIEQTFRENKSGRNRRKHVSADKQDCERKAFYRFSKKVKARIPKLKIAVTQITSRGLCLLHNSSRAYKMRFNINLFECSHELLLKTVFHKNLMLLIVLFLLAYL
ncbi:hypothetical protein [Clostridium sp.]|uniref:hypothetical protein n=1 Tax=Clostridium sp. TaxID=1506 RepID=UPI003D6D89E7